MQEKIKEILDQIETEIVGKNEVMERILMAILAGGHVLMEDVPGVGKTTTTANVGTGLAAAGRKVVVIDTDIGLREKVLHDLAYLGVTPDLGANDCRGEEVCISGADSKVQVWVVPTNEEIMIARDTAEFVK